MGLLLTFVAGSALVWWVVREERAGSTEAWARRRWYAARPGTLESLADRPRRIDGRCPAPARQKAPVTGRACAAWRIDVAEQLGGAWLDVAALSSTQPFDLEAEGLRAQVRGPFLLLLQHVEEAELDARPRPRDDALRSLCHREGIALLDERQLPRRLRFRETVLLAGDALGVVGRAGPAPRSAARGYREGAATRSIVGRRRVPVLVTNEAPLLARSS